MPNFLDDLRPFVEPVITPTISNLVIDRANNSLSFDYVAVPGRIYQIERSTMMLPSGEPVVWLELNDPIATSELESFTDKGALESGPVIFYRVRLIKDQLFPGISNETQANWQRQSKN